MDGVRNLFLQFKLYYIDMDKNGLTAELMDAAMAWWTRSRTSCVRSGWSRPTMSTSTVNIVAKFAMVVTAMDE